jgi:hypothetical protein
MAVDTWLYWPERGEDCLIKTIGSSATVAEKEFQSMPARLPANFEKGRAKAAKAAKGKYFPSFFFAAFARPSAFRFPK